MTTPTEIDYQEGFDFSERASSAYLESGSTFEEISGIYVENLPKDPDPNEVTKMPSKLRLILNYFF